MFVAAKVAIQWVYPKRNGVMDMGLFKHNRSRIVSCDEARKRVLLTGGLRIVCPDDVKEGKEKKADQRLDAHK